MKSKLVLPRELANRDVSEIIEHYLNENAPQAGTRFINALEQAYSHIGRYPGTGSSRYAHELNFPGLRSWSLKRFPYLVFYIEREDHVDVWRVLHAERDIPVWLEIDSGEAS
ncbi:type II toxin-antitoxin system RelE/ParE family toxin [Oxalobacteraceae bacterium]|nr:type II toxin-antitoxin system RelE/ParE family toxin [Oxalobacteraceae bacterium]